MYQTLSENFSKQELSTGKMKKREILVDLLLPPNEQAAGTVEPRMRALHHPSSRPMARNADVLDVFLTSTADVVTIAACSDQQADE
jgi:hypothetical protein